MAEFAAHRYPVGGLYTHGGDRETHYDDMPRDLVTIWDRDDDQWQRVDTEDGQYWYPVDANGQPVDDGLELDWHGLLDQFGPVWDGLLEPASEPDWAWV